MKRFILFFRTKVSFILLIILLNLAIILPIINPIIALRVLYYPDCSSSFSDVVYTSPSGKKQLVFAKDGEAYRAFYRETDWSNAVLADPVNVLSSSSLNHLTVLWNDDESSFKILHDNSTVCIGINLPSEVRWNKTKEGMSFLHNLLYILAIVTKVGWYVVIGLSVVWIALMIAAKKQKSRKSKIAETTA